jgi:RHS repeat-associated protein
VGPHLVGAAHGRTNSYVYGPDGSPLEQISSSGTVTFLHHDAIGSTRLLTSTAGANVGSYSYDPWGSVTGHTGTVTTPLQYTGGYTDAESGLVYLRARYYDPSTGQFINVEPRPADDGRAVRLRRGQPREQRRSDRPEVDGVRPEVQGRPVLCGPHLQAGQRADGQHIKKGRFEQGNGFSYDVLATDIKDTAAARGAEETGILALGTLGKHVSVPGHPGALKNQRHEVSEQNPRRQEMLSKGNKVMQDNFRGAMKLTNDAEQVREADNPLAQSDRNAIATESNADFIAGLESEAIEEGSRR